MNGRASKKLNKIVRKLTKRNDRDYLRRIKKYSFRERFSYCWWILFGKVKGI